MKGMDIWEKMTGEKKKQEEKQAPDKGLAGPRNPLDGPANNRPERCIILYTVGLNRS